LESKVLTPEIINPESSLEELKPAKNTDRDSHTQRIPIRRNLTTAELSSVLSRDEWGEINRYSKILDEEIKKKERTELI